MQKSQKREISKNKRTWNSIFVLNNDIYKIPDLHYIMTFACGSQYNLFQQFRVMVDQDFGQIIMSFYIFLIFTKSFLKELSIFKNPNNILTFDHDTLER